MKRSKRDYRRMKVWELHVLGGLPLATVAERLGISRRTAYSDIAWIKHNPKSLVAVDIGEMEVEYQRNFLQKFYLLLDSPSISDETKLKTLAYLIKGGWIKRAEKVEKKLYRWDIRGRDIASSKQEDREAICSTPLPESSA